MVTRALTFEELASRAGAMGGPLTFSSFLNLDQHGAGFRCPHLRC